MLALLRTRRWAGFTALVIVLILAFGLLSRWQWQRAEERRAERVAMQAVADQAPVRLDVVARPAEWTAVAVSGKYLPEHQVVVRRRPMDAVNGFWVMTPLQLDDGRIVWVNRGWQAADGPATAVPQIPPPPAGLVQVSGIWRALASGQPVANLPSGMITAPSSVELPVDSPFDGYLQRANSQPQDALVAVPVDTVDEGRNVSYAVQWLLFAAIAILGWAVFLRREAREDAQAQHAQPSGPRHPADLPDHETESFDHRVHDKGAT